MLSTKPTDHIEDFIEFMQHAAVPHGGQDRAGASLDDIRQFADAAQRPLPALYLGYLREFGGADGALKMGGDTDPRVKSLLDFYSEPRGSADGAIAPNTVVIGVYGISGNRALLYPEPRGENDGPTTGEEEGPSVVVCEYGAVDYTCARTFRNHLYRQAFIRGRFRKGKLFSLRRNEEPLLPVAREALKSQGFRGYWFSDDFQVCMEREDGEALYVERTPGRTSLYGCFPSQRTRDELKARLLQQLQLQDSTPGQ